MALVQLPGNKELMNFYNKSINVSASGSILNLVMSRLWGLGETGERKSILQPHGRSHGSEIGEVSRGHLMKDMACPGKESELHSDCPPELRKRVNPLHVIRHSSLFSDGSMLEPSGVLGHYRR